MNSSIKTVFDVPKSPEGPTCSPFFLTEYVRRGYFVEYNVGPTDIPSNISPSTIM